MYVKPGSLFDRIIFSQSVSGEELLLKDFSIELCTGFDRCSGLQSTKLAVPQFRKRHTWLQCRTDCINLGQRRRSTDRPSLDHAISSRRDRYRVTAGPAATDAGKKVTCFYGVSAATCLAWGENATVMEDGTVATATFQVSAASRNGCDRNCKQCGKRF